MNLYALLPLTAFIANVIIGCYIIYKNPKDRLNRLYALVAFSVAIWGLGDFLVFTAVTPAAALYWEKLSTLGSVSVPVLLLHFFLVFTRSKFVSRKIFYLLYIPSLLFGFLNFTTTLIPDSAELNYWGYGIAGGVLYEPFTSYIVVYIIAGLLFCYRFYSKAPSVREKSQAKLLMISIAIPLVGGVITEAVPIILGFKIIPLSSTLSAPTALIIAYAMIKYKLMTITSALAAENIIETMADYLVVADKEKNIALVSDSTIDILGYKRGEIVSKPMNIIFSRKTYSSKVIEQLKEKKYLKNKETQISTKDGKKIPVSINGSVIRDKGSIIGYVLLMRDMAEINKLIKSLEEKTKELGKSKKQLESKNIELAKFNNMAVGRELRMVELKKRIDELENLLKKRGIKIKNNNSSLKEKRV